jgi:hypothetical protein
MIFANGSVPADSHDDSEPIPESELSALARRALGAYYRDQSPGAIDLENLTVQIEKFAWQNASYRLDLFFNQKPSFLPFNSDFVMAHRMWMRRSGEIVKSEPVYRSSNLADGVAASTLSAERRGFFPGNRAFRRELEFIDGALKKAGSVTGRKGGRMSEPGFTLDLKHGLKLLQECGGAIVEKEESYHVTIEWNADIPRADCVNAHFGPHTLLEFDIDKSTGTVSPVRTRTYVPPAHC